MGENQKANTFGGINMKRQITDVEKAKLISKYRRQDGFVHCFVDDENRK